MLLMLLFGASNTIIQKFQNEIKTEDPKTGEKTMRYQHPFFQALCMFIGEFSCLGVYKFLEWRANKKYGGRENNPEYIHAQKNNLKTEINVALFAIPASFDITGSTLMFIALVLIAASIYQMMRGTLVFIIAGMSVFFLGRRLYRHHWSSLAVIFVGLFMVGLAPYVEKEAVDDDDDSKGPLLTAIGIGLIILAQFFTGGQFVTEEKLFADYYLHPLRVVGWEGAWGTLIYLILLVIFQFIPCGNNKDFCPHGTLEDTPAALREWGKEPVLWITTIFFVISIASFNSVGVTITKYASSAQRSTIDMCRTAIIWVFFLAYQGDGHETFKWLELFGFIILVFGTLVYNEVVVLPFLGFNLYTKEALAKRTKASEGSINGKLLESHDTSDLNESQGPAGVQGNSKPPFSPKTVDMEHT
jgi:drug/metabolite transporter (DMT)-like permease